MFERENYIDIKPSFLNLALQINEKKYQIFQRDSMKKRIGAEVDDEWLFEK